MPNLRRRRRHEIIVELGRGGVDGVDWILDNSRLSAAEEKLDTGHVLIWCPIQTAAAATRLDRIVALASAVRISHYLLSTPEWKIFANEKSQTLKQDDLRDSTGLISTIQWIFDVRSCSQFPSCILTALSSRRRAEISQPIDFSCRFCFIDSCSIGDNSGFEALR